MGGVVRCPLFVVRCTLSVVRCPLYVVRCPLYVVRCTLSVVRCPLVLLLCRLLRNHSLKMITTPKVAHSLTRPFARSLARSPAHSPVRSLARSLAQDINKIDGVGSLYGLRASTVSLKLDRWLLINGENDPSCMSCQLTGNTCYFQT